MKTFLALASTLATATTLLAQGRVQFANTSTTLITTNTLLQGASGPMSGAGQYVVGLFMGQAGSGFASLQPVAYATNAFLAGRFSGGANLVLPAPYDGSTAVAFQVRAWSANLGYTWAEVTHTLATAPPCWPPATSFAGSSAIGSVLPATGIATSSVLFGTGAGQISGFAMYDFVCPEPATAALAGAGLAGLLFARRRRQPDHPAASRVKPVTPQPPPKPTDG
jgi:hypothetical protein